MEAKLTQIQMAALIVQDSTGALNHLSIVLEGPSARMSAWAIFTEILTLPRPSSPTTVFIWPNRISADTPRK